MCVCDLVVMVCPVCFWCNCACRGNILQISTQIPELWWNSESLQQINRLKPCAFTVSCSYNPCRKSNLVFFFFSPCIPPPTPTPTLTLTPPPIHLSNLIIIWMQTNKLGSSERSLLCLCLRRTHTQKNEQNPNPRAQIMSCITLY